MGELLDDPWSRHRLEVRARLAELDAVALDVADAEPLADEVVEPDAARRHLPPRLAGRKPDRLDVLRLDERERASAATVVREEHAEHDTHGRMLAARARSLDEREQSLAEREQALTAAAADRDEARDRRERALSEREHALDSRLAQLAVREADLVRMQGALAAREEDLRRRERATVQPHWARKR